MDLNDWYHKGIPTDAFIGTFDKHKESFTHIYEHFNRSLIQEDERFIQNVKSKNLRVLALAEPWCGHCMLNIPILLRLTEATDMPIRFFHRDENLELMDQYLTNGKSRTIPIFIFIDEDGYEVAKWGPIAPKTKQFVNKYRQSMPPKESPHYDVKFAEFAATVSKAFAENNELWEASYENMKEALSS